LSRRPLAPLDSAPITVDSFPGLVCVLRSVVQSDANEPRMQIRLSGQEADPLLLAAFQLLQPRDNLPHIRASGKSRAAVMGRTPEDDSRMVELIDSLDDEPVKQGRGGHALPSSA